MQVGGPEGIRIASSTVGSRIPEGTGAAQENPWAFVSRHPRALAWGLSLSGGVLAAASLVVTSALSLPAWLLVVPLSLSALAVAAAVAVSRGLLQEIARAQLQPERERHVLELAAHRGGRLSVSAVAHHLSIPLSEADALLTALARQDYVDITNDPDTGEVVYLFAGLDLGPRASLPLKNGT